MMHHTQIAQRVFNTPLMVDPAKALAFLAFFGLYGSTAALATTLTLAAAINCIGIGFQRGTHTRWQLVATRQPGNP